MAYENTVILLSDLNPSNGCNMYTVNPSEKYLKALTEP